MCYCCLLEVLGVLFLQFLKIMPLLLTYRFVTSSVLVLYITFPIEYLSIYEGVCVYIVSSAVGGILSQPQNFFGTKVLLLLLFYCREDLFFQLLVILVRIAGMWYVFVQGEYINYWVLSWTCRWFRMFLIYFPRWSDFSMNAWLWLVFQETGKLKVVFKGHSDYLHCIVARNSANQVPFLSYSWSWLFSIFS